MTDRDKHSLAPASARITDNDSQSAPSRPGLGLVTFQHTPATVAKQESEEPSLNLRYERDG